jgi:hypothetical protein
VPAFLGLWLSGSSCSRPDRSPWSLPWARASQGSSLERSRLLRREAEELWCCFRSRLASMRAEASLTLLVLLQGLLWALLLVVAAGSASGASDGLVGASGRSELAVMGSGSGGSAVVVVAGAGVPVVVVVVDLG